MSLFCKEREILKDLYGLEFPDSLFHLHAFFAGMSRREQDALGMYPAGLLEVLALNRKQIAALKPKLPLLLHYRFYRDPPEFFTCLFGSCDGRHWGILLDEPDKGFRGIAHCYSRQSDPIVIHDSPFDAVFYDIEWGLESIEDDPNDEDGPERARVLGEISERLDAYIDEHDIDLDDGRPEGAESTTGLSVIVPGNRRRTAPSIFAADRLEDKGDPRVEAAIEEALAECARGKPMKALSYGRELHYMGGEEYAEDAYRLQRSAYVALERHALVRVLDLHHQHRDLPDVDLLQERS
jgi:hypothetical protein